MELVLRATLTQFLFEVPLYIVWIVGAILCLVRWRRHPAVSLIALIAIVLFFLQAILSILAVDLGIAILPGSAATFTTVVRIAQIFVSAIGWMLLLAAIFGWRSEQAKTQVDQK